MLADPRRRRAARRAAEQREPRPAPAVLVAGLAIEIADLADLAGWLPCGALLEDLPAAARGDASLTLADVARLRLWAANWRALHPKLRTFYSDNHDQPGVDAALWYVLGSRVEKPPGPVIGMLRRSYTEAYGYPPSIDLLPRPATQETPR